MNDSTAAVANWSGENNFALFRSTMPISDKQIWQAFYRLHQNKISVKRESVAIEKLKRIIKATFKLVDKKGFSLMSLRDLAHETGMSMGGLYSYIGSKNQLAEMIHQFLPHMFDLCLGEELDDKRSPWHQLTALIRAHIFITECLYPWFFFAFMETKHLDKSTKQLAKQSELKSEKLLNNIIKQGVAQNTFEPCDVYLTSLLIKAQLQNWYVKKAKFHAKNISCEDYIDFTESIIRQQLNPSSQS